MTLTRLTIGILPGYVALRKLKRVDHSVDLGELRHVVAKYVDQYNLLVAAGPVTAATLTRAFITKNKAVNLALAGSGVWFAVQEMSVPMLRLMQDQFGYLQSIVGAFRG